MRLAMYRQAIRSVPTKLQGNPLSPTDIGDRLDGSHLKEFIVVDSASDTIH